MLHIDFVKPSGKNNPLCDQLLYTMGVNDVCVCLWFCQGCLIVVTFHVVGGGGGAKSLSLAGKKALLDSVALPHSTINLFNNGVERGLFSVIITRKKRKICKDKTVWFYLTL